MSWHMAKKQKMNIKHTLLKVEQTFQVDKDNVFLLLELSHVVQKSLSLMIHSLHLITKQIVNYVVY